MERKEVRIFPICLLAGLIAGLLFALIYGFGLLDPQNVSWAMNPEKDIYQAYLGWRAFAADTWHFPLGLYNRFSYPELNSIIFTDSVPLFAVIFKLFRGVLPTHFQYFGIWTALCYFLSAALACRILLRYTESRAAALFGAEFFVFIPAMLLRTMVHAALTGQWLVILALSSLFLYREIYRRPGRAFALWAAAGLLAASVQIYFVLICGIILVGYCVCSIVDTRRVGNALRCLFGYIAAALFAVWIFGGFSTGRTSDQVKDAGFGEFSFNLNSFWNARDPDPQGIFALFRKFPWVDEAKQAEGFAYLGLGVWLLLAAALCVVLWRLLSGSRLIQGGIQKPFVAEGPVAGLQPGRSRKRDGTVRTRGEDAKGAGPGRALAAGFSTAAILAFVFAVSNVVTFNGKVLFSYPLPPLIGQFTSTFRTSGRVVWVLVYMITLAAIIFTLKLHRPAVAAVILAVLLVVQGGEQLISGRVEPVELPENAAELDFSSTDLGRAIAESGEIRHLAFMARLNPEDYYYFGRFAVENDLTMTDFWFARPAHEAADERAWQLLRELPEDTAFIFLPEQEEHFLIDDLNFYNAGDFVVACKAELNAEMVMPGDPAAGQLSAGQPGEQQPGEQLGEQLGEQPGAEGEQKTTAGQPGEQLPPAA